MRLKDVGLGLLVVLLTVPLISCGGEETPPATVAPPADLLPRLTKGYELYSWQVGREWYFTLTEGTNRLKAYEEVTSGENVVGESSFKITVQGVDDLKATLSQLPPNAEVVWRGPRMLRQFGVKPGDLSLPPRRMVQEIQVYCEEQGIELGVGR